MTHRDFYSEKKKTINIGVASVLICTSQTVLSISIFTTLDGLTSKSDIVDWSWTQPFDTFGRNTKHSVKEHSINCQLASSVISTKLYKIWRLETNTSYSDYLLNLFQLICDYRFLFRGLL